MLEKDLRVLRLEFRSCCLVGHWKSVRAAESNTRYKTYPYIVSGIT